MNGFTMPSKLVPGKKYLTMTCRSCKQKIAWGEDKGLKIMNYPGEFAVLELPCPSCGHKDKYPIEEHESHVYSDKGW